MINSLSPEAKREIEKFVNQVIDKLDLEQARKTERNKKQGLNTVRKFRRRIANYSTWGYELLLIDQQIIPYVKKHCFLPLSYRHMIENWNNKLDKGRNI